jgi:Mn2+/Fe2+ NRAMP family transporter
MNRWRCLNHFALGHHNKENNVRNSIIPSIYIAIGIVVALNHGYSTITNVSQLLSLLIAVVLWPAVLLGYNLMINLGI